MKRTILEDVKDLFPKCIGKACKLLGTSRSSLHYKSIKDDTVLIEKLQQFAKDHPREGFWKGYHRIRNAGFVVNHKHLHRVYKMMGLPLRRKVKKRLPVRVKEPLQVAPHFNHTWSIDFMSDATASGVKFRSFHVLDDYNREALHIELGYSIKSTKVIYILDHLVKRYGKPQKIRMDNGPEFIAHIMQYWSESQQIAFKYIQPGKPTQNAYIERFNRTYRDKVLDAYIIDDLNELREITDDFIEDYNNHRPHDALGGIPPVKYRLINANNDLTLNKETKHLKEGNCNPVVFSSNKNLNNEF